MVSLRFPFLFSQPTKNTPRNSPHGPESSHQSFSTTAAAAMAGSVAVGVGVGVGIGMGVCISQKLTNQRDPFFQNAKDFFFSHYRPNSSSSPMWGSLSLADNASDSVNESKTGASFPAVLNGTRRLLGIGLRKKSVFGLKNIDVYAFGVYADDGDVKNLLSEKYGGLSVSELKEKKGLHEDFIDNDICMTIRLQIVYGRLSIRSVRNAFEESVGSRLTKFGGPDNADLLQRFTSQFKDEYKLPRGSVIDISRERGHVLRTTIDGKEAGSIQSQLLCRSILDLYIGEDPFDTKAKEDIKLTMATLVKK